MRYTSLFILLFWSQAFGQSRVSFEIDSTIYGAHHLPHTYELTQQFEGMKDCAIPLYDCFEGYCLGNDSCLLVNLFLTNRINIELYLKNNKIYVDTLIFNEEYLNDGHDLVLKDSINKLLFKIYSDSVNYVASWISGNFYFNYGDLISKMIYGRRLFCGNDFDIDTKPLNYTRRIEIKYGHVISDMIINNNLISIIPPIFSSQELYTKFVDEYKNNVINSIKMEKIQLDEHTSTVEVVFKTNDKGQIEIVQSVSEQGPMNSGARKIRDIMLLQIKKLDNWPLVFMANERISDEIRVTAELSKEYFDLRTKMFREPRLGLVLNQLPERFQKYNRK